MDEANNITDTNKGLALYLGKMALDLPTERHQAGHHGHGEEARHHRGGSQEETWLVVFQAWHPARHEASGRVRRHGTRSFQEAGIVNSGGT